MKTYKLDKRFFINFINFYFYLTIINSLACIAYAIWLLSDYLLGYREYIQVGLLVLGAISLLFSGIICKKQVSRYKFRSVAVDKNESRFIFTTKEYEICCVNFNDVESIYVVRNKVLPGLNIKTYKGDSYSVAITSIDDFYADLPAEINKIVEEGNFFKTDK